jgi:glycosyltransferase involved in cell wall biosynthesis
MESQLTLPTISVVTPSLNRKRYLAPALDSVLGQGYPALEYVVVDGGSTDGSVAVIEERESQLAWWVSEPDEGPWQALNKGFQHTTGEVMCWLGSDDLLTPWALGVVGEVFATFPQVEWLTTLYPIAWDEHGHAVRCFYQDAYSRQAFFRGANLPGAGWPATGWIQQESTFWRRSLWDRVGARLDDSLRLAADFDLWARFHQAGAELVGVATPLGGFRMHGDQKSAGDLPGYVDEAKEIFFRAGGRPGGSVADAVRRLVPRRFGAAGLHTPQPMCVHHGPGAGWRLESR